eukprot:CAMPEP_0204534018 /NCGR_PEP_ID=MMETSP0661-20131031/12634_1 /ASSEMBLY_ACC=CAM_ASM_000606 /TAXON_ID=109239 /ORGANISM="Alexandrium margalefi, Strain AMGDE01CS-322" /LENGTH=119 /DNA_ID=CAMNT_0051540445 /DNA_START=79 /DNA_END=438 /DNA_ORIENTATION=-
MSGSPLLVVGHMFTLLVAAFLSIGLAGQDAATLGPSLRGLQADINTTDGLTTVPSTSTRSFWFDANTTTTTTTTTIQAYTTTSRHITSGGSRSTSPLALYAAPPVITVTLAAVLVAGRA